jgi:signal transduction histidine kinase
MAGGARLRFAPFDGLLTGLLLLTGIFGTGPASANQGLTTTPAAYVLVVLAALPVLVWRNWPLWTFVASNAMTLLYLTLGYAYGPILFSTAVTVFGMAWRLPVRRALTAMSGLLAAAWLMIGVGVLAGDRDWTEFIALTAWLVIPAAVGIALKVRRDAASDVRAEQARRAASEERLRLAREVHDVAGHGFAVIAMQAGVALRVLDRDPAGARAALEGIRAVSKEALESLRAEIEAMRHPDAPLRPASGLADLPALAERIRTSGLPVTLDDLPAPTEVPEAVDRAAYRIVQESLTNVLRHGGAAAVARVTVRHDGDALRLEVTSTGTRARDVEPGGRGIDGMRARAEALGGTLDAGPIAGGGFAVWVRLPVPAP